MKLAIYYPWIYLCSGIERTILELCKRSRHSWTIFTSHYNPSQTFPEFQNLEVILLPRISVSRDYLSLGKAALRILSLKLDLHPYQGLLVHSEGLGDLITFRNHKIPTICYCHTPLKVLHDPTVRLSYTSSHPLKTFFFYPAGAVFNLLDRYAWRYYSYILCSSQEVKKRILRAKLAPLSKLEVLPLGVDTQKWVNLNSQGEYFLVPSRIKWWKNLELAIHSYREFLNASPRKDKYLLIAGQLVAGSENYLAKLKKLAQGLPVEFIINPSQEEFQHLIQNSYAVLNTTLNEDGGIVVMEAMASGKPVIAVNRGGPTDIIVHRKNGFLLEPNPKSFAETMAMLAEDRNYALQIGQQARNTALKYDWSNFVSRIDALFDKLAG